MDNVYILIRITIHSRGYLVIYSLIGHDSYELHIIIKV